MYWFLYVKGGDTLDDIKIVPDSEYSPVGDMEPYDQYSDDKLTGDEPVGN